MAHEGVVHESVFTLCLIVSYHFNVVHCILASYAVPVLKQPVVFLPAL